MIGYYKGPKTPTSIAVERYVSQNCQEYELVASIYAKAMADMPSSQPFCKQLALATLNKLVAQGVMRTCGAGTNRKFRRITTIDNRSNIGALDSKIHITNSDKLDCTPTLPMPLPQQSISSQNGHTSLPERRSTPEKTYWRHPQSTRIGSTDAFALPSLVGESRQPFTGRYIGCSGA